ncbi:hypothetical protein DRN62_02235 [Nanoarchaeota archaeon]|nr:MAG: hypothetical protein DRN62_02235 [Nanoarchaeota archaeon]
MGKKLLFSIISSIILLASGGYMGDRMLRENFNMTLFEVMNLLVQTTSPPKFGDVEEVNISEENMSALMKEKEDIESILMEVNVSQVNENENITSLLRTLFGENYTIHFYTFFEYEGKAYKLVKWEIWVENGTITYFGPGEPENPDLNVGVSYDILRKLDEVDQEIIMSWLEEGKVKIYPLSELLRFMDLLPQLSELIGENKEVLVG